MIGDLREIQQICQRFWKEVEREPDHIRPSLEAAFDRDYDAAKARAWDALDKFADSAAERLERSAFSLRRISRVAR